MTTALAPSLASTILTPADAGWRKARQAWDLAVDQNPAAIARPRSEADVVGAVDYARAHGWRVAAQATGHGAAPLGSLAGTLLVKTDAMRGVRIDPAARMARVQAGALWQDVTDAAAAHGLAALAGSSPNVGVVGYTLGGGMGWLGRAYGLSASNVAAIELATADGRCVRADSCREKELFWALRGGGGSFGIVTAVELHLFPISEVYAGLLWWPAGAASEVLQAWRQVTRSGVPDEFTSAARMMRFPATPRVPEPLRGQPFVVIDVIHLGTPAEADALIRPLRQLEPVQDTVRMISMRALSHLHMDPDQPTAAVGDGLMLSALPATAIDRVTGAFVQPVAARLLAVELRQVGGEMARTRPGNGALAAVEAEYALFAVGPGATPAERFAVTAAVAAVKSALAPWAAKQMYLNLAHTSRDPASFWNPQAYARLRQIKAAVDPGNMIRANHPIPPATA